jgi:ATP-dependent DNA helicase RecG
VGRGEVPGRCILIPSAGAPAEARARLKVLERETDGFRIAEEDLRLRGPGELAGVRQAGAGGALPLEPGSDRALFEAAYKMAKAMVSRGRWRPGDGSYYDLLAGRLAELPGRPADAV